MCTSLTLPVPHRASPAYRLFGRTLDLDTHFGESIVLTRGEALPTFGEAPLRGQRHPLLGMATVEQGYPLYAEAMNDQGLYMAGLRFAGEAHYARRPELGRINLAPWELIPYLLRQYTTVEEVRRALSEICLVGLPFSDRLPAAPLHWHVADADPTHGELVIEPTAQGLTVYENPVGVLTNPPVFSEHLARLSSYESHVSPQGSPLGTGGVGLPGDYSSASRFVRGAILRKWAVTDMETCYGAGGEALPSPVGRFFHLLAAVAPPRGAVVTAEGGSPRTLYACCMDGAAGVYHVITESSPGLRTVGFRNGGADVIL